MAKGYRRTPRGYDSTGVTSHRIGDLLPVALSHINGCYQARGELILASWPAVIGAQLAPMTQALAFASGILTVKVRNSTLHSLLVTQEKGRLLAELRRRFPHTPIHTIVFKIG